MLTTPCAQFVQSLSNPLYLQHLAAQKYLEDADFVRYIEYLHYFAEPEYIKFLQYAPSPSLPSSLFPPMPATERSPATDSSNDRYPGPTLRALELLQQEDFRRAIISPQLVDSMVREGFEAATAGLGR